MQPKISAGLLMYRIRHEKLEIFLVHPGGPLYRNKDRGHWSIPKGEPPEGGETLLETAMREFEEETGIRSAGPFLELGRIRQKGGKEVHAWAFAGEWDDSKPIRSNMFEMEWPPGSGQMRSFPEVDCGKFLSLDEARLKLRESQWPLVERLQELLNRQQDHK